MSYILKVLRDSNRPIIREIKVIKKIMGKKKAPGSNKFTTKLFQISRRKPFLLDTVLQTWTLPVHSTKQIYNQPFPPSASTN